MTYVRTLKRIRQDKTNYRKRAALILGRHSFVTIKVSDQNVAAQLLKPTQNGDLVLTSAHSRELEKSGWKGSLNSLPACYLTGLLLGTKALAKGTSNAILYIGKDKFTSRVAACLRGVVDAGIKIPVSEDSLPEDDRITGRHIADYASALKQNQDEYNSRFSTLLKNGLNPENYPAHFEEVRFKISGKPSTMKPKEAKEDKASKKGKEGKKEQAAGGKPKEKAEKGEKKSEAKKEGGKKSK
ncbi:MAG: 50S ribosomal protein L18 [Nitrososphaera sp.]